MGEPLPQGGKEEVVGLERGSRRFCIEVVARPVPRGGKDEENDEEEDEEGGGGGDGGGGKEKHE